MDLGLRDKVVFISGASGGIGRALAQTFAAEGAFLALHGHRQWEALNELWYLLEITVPIHSDFHKYRLLHKSAIRCCISARFPCQ